MANPTWPTSLPRPLVQGCSYEPAFDNVLRSQMDIGTKSRRRATAVPERVTFQLDLDRAQHQTLIDFMVVTLKEVLPFDWVDFRKPDDTLVTYKFVRRPKITPKNGKRWIAQIELLQMTTFQGTFLLDVAPLTT